MFRVPGVAVQIKNDADCITTLLCYERRRISGSTCLVRVMALLFDGDFTSSRQKTLRRYREKYPSAFV